MKVELFITLDRRDWREACMALLEKAHMLAGCKGGMGKAARLYRAADKIKMGLDRKERKQS